MFSQIVLRVWLRLSTRLEAIPTSPAVVEVDAVEGAAEGVEEEEAEVCRIKKKRRGKNRRKMNDGGRRRG